MSNPLAIGAVTAVLRNIVDHGLVDAGSPLGTVKVTAVAPDAVSIDDPEAPPSLNLFLYRTTPNAGWRNVGLPAFDTSGSRVANPPLALDLHFLLTAYGSADFQAEILLGYAMQLLHERPVLDRATIRRALDPNQLGSSTLPATLLALTGSDLADQVDTITVTPESLDTEELSRLWSALQAHYRPSVAYRVSVVLIEAEHPVQSALPVLTRGGRDPSTHRERGVSVTPSLVLPFPTVDAALDVGGRAMAHLGEPLTLTGHHLAGDGVRVRFAHRALANANEIVLGANAAGDHVTVALPGGATADAAWPAGIYGVSVVLVPQGEASPRESNATVVVLPPVPDTAGAVLTRDPQGRVSVILEVHPSIRQEQDVRLALGSHAAVAEARTSTTSTLHFSFGTIDPGPAWVRLTVDGIDSELIDHSSVVPGFDPSQSVVVPA